MQVWTKCLGLECAHGPIGRSSIERVPVALLECTSCLQFSSSLFCPFCSVFPVMDALSQKKKQVLSGCSPCDLKYFHSLLSLCTSFVRVVTTAALSHNSLDTIAAPVVQTIHLEMYRWKDLCCPSALWKGTFVLLWMSNCL